MTHESRHPKATAPVAAEPDGSTYWQVRCPICHRLVIPTWASLHYVILPRLAWHMLEQHPFEATSLRLRLSQPPSEWPALEAITP